jgi:hypothetical protein
VISSSTLSVGIAVHWLQQILMPTIGSRSNRGLARNKLDAYSRGLERYLRFMIQLHFSC